MNLLLHKQVIGKALLKMNLVIVTCSLLRLTMATAPLTLFLMFDLRGKILTTWFDSYLIFDFNSVDLGLWDILRLMFVRLSEACLLLLASSIHFFTGRRSYCNINNSILTRSSALGQYGICDVPR